MPNDEGLRRCKCGQYILLKDMVEVGTAESAALPFMDRVPDAQFPECIAKASSQEMEVAARLGYWRHLNHPYRQAYRQHRDAEEAATKAKWEAENADRRTRWDKFRGRNAPIYSRPTGSPFTYPAFDVSGEQLENMRRLSGILDKWHASSRTAYTLELAELYREQGRFGEAEGVILTLAEQDADVTSNLIASLVKERQTAPMRYKM